MNKEEFKSCRYIVEHPNFCNNMCNIASFSWEINKPSLIELHIKELETQATSFQFGLDIFNDRICLEAHFPILAEDILITFAYPNFNITSGPADEKDIATLIDCLHATGKLYRSTYYTPRA